ncbi:MAG: glutathione S-transferase N-terminal domain-containing protein [Rhodopila sp.]|jgi:glutathione S-transferase
MKLISATPSPYARKVRIALAEKSLPFKLQTEVPWNDDTTLHQHNPLEKLPVLILDDGSTIWESSFILEWIERKFPSPPLLPSDDDGILAHKRMDALATGVCDAFLLIFFEWRRPEAHRSQPWIDRQMRKVRGGIAEIARVVGDQPYAVRDMFGIADVAAGSVLGYLDVRFPELGWRTTHPNLARYMDGLMERPSFQATVPYPQTITSAVV